MNYWPDKPNNWPTGEQLQRTKPGFFNRLLGVTERGVVGGYTYASGGTYVPVRWESGETEYVHISEIPGA